MKRITMALVASVLCIPTVAVEILLTEEEKAVCAEEGGCTLVTKDGLKAIAKHAFDQGKKACNQSI